MWLDRIRSELDRQPNSNVSGWNIVELLSDVYTYRKDLAASNRLCAIVSKLVTAIEVPQSQLQPTKATSALNGGAGELLQHASRLFAEGRFNEAIDVFKQTLQDYQSALSDRDTSNVLASIGNAYSQTRNYTPALSAYEEAVSYYDSHAPAWYGIGWCNYLNNSLAIAVSAFRKAWSLDPSFWLARYFLAESLYWAQQYSRASDLLYEFVEEMQKLNLRDNAGHHCRPHPRPFTVLAACEIFENNYVGANFSLMAALNIDPNYEDAKKLLSTMYSLRATGQITIELDFPFHWKPD